ncbi:MAG TPA: phosphatidylglycerophosphatase A [Clostridia bacterium]|nr:phosphatidylglycerophosphatase A [Clostridia bacterium]
MARRAESEQNRLSQLAREYLEKRGVTVVEIAAIVYDLQKPYIPELTLEACIESVYRVLDKREVQNAIFTGVTLDRLAECGLLEEPLQTFVFSDDGLYGIDEVLALSIVNIYGSIGFTNFGYLDKVKPGAIGLANGGAPDCPWTASKNDASERTVRPTKEGRPSRDKKQVNTFLDDIISAIAAAAAARIAHQSRDGKLSC